MQLVAWWKWGKKMTEKELYKRILQVNHTNSVIFQNMLIQLQWSKADSSVVGNELKNWLIETYNGYFDYYNINFDDELSEEQKKLLEDFNFINSMADKLERAGYIKFQEGQVALVNTIKENKIVPLVLYIVGQPVYENGKLVKIYLSPHGSSPSENRDEQFISKFFIKNKKVYSLRVDFISPEEGDDKVGRFVSHGKEKKFLYKGIDYLPVEILKANPHGESIVKGCESSINSYAYFMRELNVEWKYVRSFLTFNRSLNPETSAERLQKEIETQDKRGVDTINRNGLLENILEVLAGNGNTITSALDILQKLKDDIKEHLFITAQTPGKNNKHTTEALNDNVNAYSKIWSLRMRMSQDISRYYYKVLHMQKVFEKKEVGELPEFIKCEIQLARPLENLLNLSADSSEKDDETLAIKRSGDDSSNSGGGGENGGNNNASGQ